MIRLNGSVYIEARNPEQRNPDDGFLVSWCENHALLAENNEKKIFDDGGGKMRNAAFCQSVTLI